MPTLACVDKAWTKTGDIAVAMALCFISLLATSRLEVDGSFCECLCSHNVFCYLLNVPPLYTYGYIMSSTPCDDQGCILSK
jgi:hypothetical protein